MKKLIFFVMALTVIAGCVTTDPRITQLEQKVARLERQVVMGAATGAGASFYPATGALVGGGTGALDKIPSTVDKDAAIVMFNAEATYGNAFMPFTLDEAGGCGTEVEPYCIESASAGEWWEMADVWGMNLFTPGKIKGKIDVIADANGRSIAKGTITSGSEIMGDIHLATGTGTWLLPAMAATDGTGWSMCLFSTTADDVILDTDGDMFLFDGTYETAGDTLTISDIGAYICVVLTDYATDVAHWTVFGYNGTVTPQ
jgi:hypothetical protein